MNYLKLGLIVATTIERQKYAGRGQKKFMPMPSVLSSWRLKGSKSFKPELNCIQSLLFRKLPNPLLNRAFCLLPSAFCLLNLLGMPGAIAAGSNATINKSAAALTQPQFLNCSANLETLTPLLLRDLPSYANRVSQSSRRLSRESDVYSYFILAGRPEYTPLTLGPGQYQPTEPKASSEGYQQVFITTLERTYTKRQVIELQQFHWLFLTQTPNGWYLGMMLSQTGSYPNVKPPSPPRESTNGVVGQAISNWLRDCRAGYIRM